MSGNSKRENRETPSMSQLTFDWDRSGNVTDGNPEMDVDGESDGSVVPAKSANNGGTELPAESMEERDPAKRNAGQDDSRRNAAPGQTRVSWTARRA